MTAQEAIEILRNVAWLGSDADRERTEEAIEVALDALDKRIPMKPMVSINVCNNNLRHLYCPTCGSCLGMISKRLESIYTHNDTNKEICANCGRVIDMEVKV